MEKLPTSNAQDKAEEHVEKQYLYHMVPEDMQGTVLHPLNSMKEARPELYLAKSGKYADRPEIMEQFIPTLEAAWNDVLHFTAVNPAELKEALVEAGMEPKEMKFYQIDPAMLDPKETTIYLYQDKTSEDKMNEESFAAYDPEKLHEHAGLPSMTKEYYMEMIGQGKKPLLFVGVPHILHKGSVDISDLPIITV